MSQQDKRVDYTIGVKSEGLNNLSRLAGGLDEASAEAAELKAQAAEVARQLQDVAQQQQAIDTLRSLGAESRTCSQQLEQASANVDRLAAALPDAAAKTQALAQAERQAGQAVQAAQADIKGMQQALSELRSGSDQATRATTEYKASVAQAQSAIAELRQQLQAQKEGLSQAAAATRAAADEEKALQREYDGATKSAGKASAALGDKRRAMETTREVARQLGVDTTSLSEAQKQVDAASRQAQQGLEAAAQSARRIAQSQTDAAQAARTFEQDLRKLGMDGVQAPAGLEQAFRKLGMGGVRQAEAAVHELQVALAQIRNSADILPADKAAAVAAFTQRIGQLRAEADKTTDATQQLGTATQNTGTSMADAARKAAAWGGALVGLGQLKSLAESVVETGSQFENLQVRLSNLLGSTESATQAFGMLKQLAASTPFDVAGLTESFVTLTSFGMKPTEAQMRSIADVAANLGGGTDKLTGVTLALGQAWTKTKLQGEEILQLAERGVPVWDALARATGRTVPELQRMSEAGLLGRDVISKLIDELGRMNEGASDRLMRTYAGAVANAKDALAEFFDMVAQAGVLDWLTDKVRELLVEFERMKESGELQKKAKEIADAFLQLATMAETATQALVAMAPAIELGVKVLLALKAVNAAQTLWAVATGARAAGAGMTAAGVASATAAVQMDAAAAAGGRMAIALRILRSLTGIGLALGVAELAQEFFRAKRAAEEGDAAVRKMLETPPATNQPKKAVEDVNASLEKTSFKATDALTAFDRLMEQGGKTSEALSKIGKDFDLSTAPGIRDAAVVLDGLLQQGKITAKQFRDEWANQLKDIDLSDFELRARSALDKTWEGVGRLKEIIDAGLREAVRRAGGDFDVISGGMGKAAQSAINDTHLIIQNLDRLKETGADVGRVLSLSLSKAINTADSEKALAAVRSQIEQVRKVLGDKVADGLLEQAKVKADELKDAINKIKPGIDDVREAMKQLGITSDESLKRTAATSKEAYEVIRTSGTASARELSAGFKRAAEAAIEAGNGIAPAWVRSEAAIRGFDLEVDKAGKSVLKVRDNIGSAADASRRAGGSMAGDWKGVTSAVKEADAALAAYQQRVKEKHGRPGEGDKPEELGEGVQRIGSGYRNKDGFTSDAKGNTQTQFIWTRAMIIDYLKQAGLDEAVAVELSKQFLDANGDVPYEASDVQIRWGGKNSTLASALGKMAEYYKYDASGKHEAAYMLEQASGKPTTPAPAPPPAPGPGPGPGTGSGSTYVNNITINGIEPWGFLRGTTSHTSQQSAQTEVDLLQKIAQAKGTAA